MKSLTNYSFVSKYIKHVNASFVLIFFTVLALVFANVGALKGWYFDLWNLPVSFSVGSFNLFSHFINLGNNFSTSFFDSSSKFHRIHTSRN